ncbi:flavin monoamine oxidase family protein [Ideonella sp.]|uniref:flavin monoamine oxidase family protein n=1 Tax=Ideonella sp. TaxID=1929293 RepID=UPI0035B01F57
MKRRQLMQLAGSAAVAASAVAMPGAAKAAARQNVLIIGAGMAGLRAGQVLKANGHNVTILEGRNRIGGRCYTSHQWADLPMDLGAHWIHESGSGNPLTPIAKALGLRLVSDSYNSNTNYLAGSGQMTSSQVTYFNKIGDKVETAMGNASDSNTEMSLMQYTKSKIGYNNMNAYDKRLSDYWMRELGGYEYAGDTAELSAWYWDTGKEFPGPEVYMPDTGYEPIITYLAQGQDIRLNQIVSKVAYTNSGVTVTTNAGTFTGDRVIVTVPLGVLKKNKITFSPALPSAKQTAINKLGMGTGVLDKVVLRFPYVFWPTTDWLAYVPSSTELGKFHDWFNPSPGLHGMPVIIGFTAGFYGQQTESLTNQQTVDTAMAVLRDMFGNDIPDPVDYQLTRWDQDPFSYGSYSFYAVGSTRAMIDSLATGVSNRLFFAGEHTNRDYPQTTHGAYLTGERAANQIMAL